MKNPRFIGLKVPEVARPETLERRYRNKLSAKALDFMQKCLQLDPNDRMTAEEAVNHPYFEGLRDAQPVRK